MKKTPLMRKFISVIAIIMIIAMGLSACEITVNTPDTTTTTTTTQAPGTTTETPPITTDPVHVHDVVIDPEVFPSCTKIGLTEGSHCATCNEILISQRVVPALGHTEKPLPPVSPTPDSSGLTEGLVCDVCGEILQEQEPINPLLPNTYSITYHECKGATIDEKYLSYTENEGLSTLPQLTADLYQFEGWFTKDGVEVTSIPAGSNQNYVLYAKWTQVEFAINYYDLLVGTTTPSGTYKKGGGLTPYEMPIPEASGYKFLGWGTVAPSQTYKTGNLPDFNKISLIPEDAEGTYNLFAYWERLVYTIEYVNVGSANNPTEYTIEDTITLKPATWEGLIFSHWIDENSEEIDKIDTKVTGNRKLTACWYSKENYATSDIQKISTIWDEETQRILIVYKLGTLENVKLETLKSQEKGNGNTLTFAEESKISYETTMAETIAKTTAMSVTKTESYSKTTRDLNMVDNSVEFGVSAELSYAQMAKISASVKATLSTHDEQETVTVQANGYGETFEQSDSVSSMLSFTKNYSKSMTVNHTIEANMPEGTYQYVCFGRVNVYAIITYDTTNGEYFLNTYSLLEAPDVPTYGVLYANVPAHMNVSITQNIGLDCVDDTTIKADIAATYYVQFDANGANGTMEEIAMVLDEEQKLPKNQFSKVGYVFDGWIFKTETEEICFTDKQSVINLTSPGEKVTLIATWKRPTNALTCESIDAIPSILTNEYTVIDLIQETGTTFSNQILKVSNAVKRIDLVGSPDKTFTDLYFELVDFADGQELVIYMQDFNFVTNANSAFVLSKCGNIKLTIVVEGNSSIKTSVAGGNAINIGTSDLEIRGSGSLLVVAGDGADGASHGQAGNNGGIGIIADELTFSGYVSCEIRGGNGGDGINGSNGANGSNGPNNGGLGEDGGNGGNGGEAYTANTFLIGKSNTIILVYGDGGNGGNGGDGGDGGYAINGKYYYLQQSGITVSGFYDVTHGGSGGDGGNGGNGGAGATGSLDNISINPDDIPITIDEILTKQVKIINGTFGNGGNGGNGGDGRDGGNAGSGSVPKGTLKHADEICGTTTGGNGGNGGKGGNGGNGSTPGNGGTGGSRGEGGDGSYLLFDKDIGKDEEYCGSPGSPGTRGSNGTDGSIIPDESVQN